MLSIGRVQVDKAASCKFLLIDPIILNRSASRQTALSGLNMAI